MARRPHLGDVRLRRHHAAISPHWLRQAHGSHAIDDGAPLHEVQATLGHAKVITTSGYMRDPAAPVGSSSIRECFFNEEED